PLARALRNHGHAVAFSSSERFCQRIEQAGYQAFVAGIDLGEAYERTLAKPEAAALAGDQWAFGAHMFAGVAGPAKAKDLSKAIAAFSADLMVHDPMDFAGPLAAASAGLACAGHGFGAISPKAFCQLAAELAEPAWQSWGLEFPPLANMFGDLYLDVCPPSFQDADISCVPSVQPLRPGDGDTVTGDSAPDWFDDLSADPRVYVTLGTIDNDAPGVFEAVLSALGARAFNVVVTVGPSRDPAELGPQPDNIFVASYLPQSLILPRCHAVVCHGGSGTTLAALRHGLPLLLLPQGANQFWNAERCEALGVGSSLTGDQLTVDAIGVAVDRLLAEPSYRQRAQSVRTEIDEMPNAEEAVALLERLSKSAKMNASRS
ncbi:MAG: glycosyltransferase, partial [Pseudonocardiaceae bacterium]